MITHASVDARFHDHPGLKLYGIESYIAVPVFRRNGDYFGTLCALDPDPKALSDDTLTVFALLAELITHELEAAEKQAHTEAKLMNAEATARLRERFVAILSHDLRTPLQAILLGAQLMQAHPDQPPSFADPLQRIVSAAKRLKQLSRDLLDFTRHELGGQLPHRPQPCDLKPLAEQLVAEVLLAFPGRQIALHCVGDSQGQWDPDRLGQALMNLLTNALQYSPEAMPVLVHIAGVGAEVTLSVHNQGPPIPLSRQAHLFDPYKAAADPGKLSPGVGLGLPIAMEIARAHGGTLQVHSDEQQGTTVTLYLPQVNKEGTN